MVLADYVAKSIGNDGDEEKDLKARPSSGNSDVSPVSSSNAHYSTTVPTNACTKLTTFSASLDPAGPVRDCGEITLRFEIDSTTAPGDSDYSSNDETVGRSKLE
ncbi:hypothetical protein BKA57DRAFT_434401 [Linnemannia elongata]|nr:hypothetical protein BKA57DRAFT_434401 [Linnemannia elongata]